MIGCPTYRRAIARKLLRGLQCRSCTISRGLASKAKGGTLPANLLVAESSVAQQLLDTGHWRSGRSRISGTPSIDTRRVNIVSEELCSDIIKYIGPSLDRHHGCDILDLNPGTGLWSRALHATVQPRTHILLDPDAEFYKPHLADLVSRPNVELIQKSGIIWGDLEDIVTSRLTQQTKVARGGQAAGEERAPPQRNDTLLVTANLSMCPKRPYRGFDNVGTMVLYQFLSSIRQAALLQQYGLVRFLIWTNDEDKHRVLPRTVLRRRRSAFEAELSCDWLHEVCGSSVDTKERIALRDEWLNIESCAAAMDRMDAAGLTMPVQRQSALYGRISQDPSLRGQKWADFEIPQLARPYIEELDRLRDTVDTNTPSPELRRLKQLGYRDTHEHKLAAKYGQLIQQRVAALSHDSSSSSFAALDDAYNTAAQRLNKNKAAEFQRINDNHHLFRQPTHPALLWDRRAYEPLVAHATEFFPNAPTTLLDMQPKAMAPVLRQYGPSTSRSGEMSDVLLHLWFANTLGPLQDGLERLWGGFGSELARCGSFVDVARGGSPLSGVGRVAARCVNEAQWVDVMEAWMEWPFRPSYIQLLSRWAEETENGDGEDIKSGAQGLGF